MTRRHLNLLVLLIILGGVAILIWYGSRTKPIEVTVGEVSRNSVEQTVANTRAGTVKACRRARLSPGVGGQIALLQITEGDQVKNGQLLLELWNKDLKAQISLNESESTSAIAHAKATCLQADVHQREADRLVRLQKTGAISEELVDQVVTNAKSRYADCESANASIRVSQARLGVAKANLERTQLVAPFDGIVAEVNGELNEYVTPSPPGIPTPPAVDLIDNTCFYVAAPIDEVDAPKIKVDMPAKVTLDAFGERHFPGRVRRIAPYVLDVEKQARTVEVEVEFSEPNDIKQLLAGYSADVEIILQVHDNTLRIPTESLLEDNRVLLFSPGSGLLEERKIEIGIANWDHTEVLSGLSEGEKVVTSIDLEGVEDGASTKLKQ